MTDAIRLGRDDLIAWEDNRPSNFYESDLNFQRTLAMYLDLHDPALRSRLMQTGEISVGRMDRLARQCNRDLNLPRLERYTGVGERIEQVQFHPAQQALDQIVWNSGVLSGLEKPGREVLCGALEYLFDQNGEAGTACPVACTAGAIKLLQRVGSDSQQRRYLPGLLQEDSRERLYASQFITEVQGGSDVGSNACVATPIEDRPGWYRIDGEKWFCSVIDADLFVMTARPVDAPEGTKGLGLFLVPRRVNGEINHFKIRRLKDKLGTRSLASAEVDFEGALGEQIGPIEQGFKSVISIVLDTSRVHNAIAACGFMRRAFTDAHTFASVRRAFGSPIIKYPAIQEILARMKVHTQAAIATTFRILDMTDRIARGDGDDQLVAARRVQVNINKYWTAIRCSEVVRDAIEILGGNGTIEEFSILPRLYRDSIVIESWEGTHNTLCAQIYRDFVKRDLHRPWSEEVARALSEVSHPDAKRFREQFAALLATVESNIDQLLAADAHTAGFMIRHVVDRMAILNSAVSLLLELDWQLHQELSGDKFDVLELFRLMMIDRTDPLDSPDLAGLCFKVSQTL